MTRATGALVPCQICGEGMDKPFVRDGVRYRSHRECLLRSVLGGIGHLTDHEFWCNQMHDPDGGKTCRESALLVDQWVQENGTFSP